MVRWLSEAKSIILPQEKVSVNYTYSQPQDLSEVQEIVSDSLKAFGKWGCKNLNVWICNDHNEWRDVHSRLIKTVPQEEFEALEEPLGKMSLARMVYATKEVQDTLGIREEKVLVPNLVINSNEFSKADKKIRKSLIKHEFSHKFSMDYGYFLPILKSYQNIQLVYMPLLENNYVLFKTLQETCDEISTNEVCIDFGFKDDVFRASKYILNDFKSYENEKEKAKPLKWFLPIMEFSSLPLPFEHKNENSYASRMREAVDSYLKKVKVLDAVALRVDFENILDKVRNPPNVSDLETVYDGVKQKFEEVRLGSV